MSSTLTLPVSDFTWKKKKNIFIFNFLIFKDVLVSSTLTLPVSNFTWKKNVAPGEHSFFFFQVKLFTGSVSVSLTSTSIKFRRTKTEVFECDDIIHHTAHVL